MAPTSTHHPAHLPSAARALPWLLCFQFFVAEQISRIHVTGPYSMAHDYISDLGAIHCFHAGLSCSPWHPLMNASFTLQGLLIVTGALLVSPLVPAGNLARTALLTFAVSGFGLLLVGLNPEDARPALHYGGATVHFLAGAVAMLFMGAALLRAGKQPVAGLSLVAGSVALAATVLLGFRDSPAWDSLGWSIGTVERLAAYPLPLWLTCAGFVMLRQGRRPHPALAP